jgi:RNA polymerase sigma factor (sigma-70 family)
LDLLYSRKHDTATDAHLLASYHESRDPELAGMLLERYALLLMGVCMKYLQDEEKAKDAVQQIFLKVLNDLWKYQVENFSSWLYQVAKNHCFMQFRQEKKLNRRNTEQQQFSEDDRTIMEEIVFRELQLENLAEAIERLNEQQRVCIRMFYLEEKSYRQVADTTGFSIGEVKSYIQNGKRNLKIQMDKIEKQNG